MKFSSQNLVLISLLMVASTPMSLADIGYNDGQDSQQDPGYNQPGSTEPGFPSDNGPIDNQGGLISRQIDQLIEGGVSMSLQEALGMNLYGQEVASVLIRAHGVGKEGLITVRSQERFESRMVAGWSEEHEFQMAPGSSDMSAIILDMQGRFVLESVAVRLRGASDDPRLNDGRNGGDGCDHGDSRGRRGDHNRDNHGRYRTGHDGSGRSSRR